MSEQAPLAEVPEPDNVTVGKRAGPEEYFKVTCEENGIARIDLNVRVVCFAIFAAARYLGDVITEGCQQVQGTGMEADTPKPGSDGRS